MPIDTLDTPRSNGTTTATRERHPPLGAKALLILTTSFSGQNFLGQPWLPALLRLVPESYRRDTALRILGMSPHYFIYQWTNRYPDEMSRSEVLEAEHERNKRSRRALFDTVLRQYITDDMTVMDFGCGPGYLAHEAAQHAERVVAVDISPGAIACANVLNGHNRIDYMQNARRSIDAVDDASIDLIYTFAVVQHMQDEAVKSIVREWLRVLKPGGQLICHVALRSGAPSSDGPPTNGHAPAGLRGLYALRMQYRTKDRFRALLQHCGFDDIQLSFFQGLGAFDDDLAHESFIICSKS